MQRSAQRAECRERAVPTALPDLGTRRDMLSVALFRILYHQSITIVAHGQLVLGDTFGYLDNFCILEGPSDREACTHCTYLASVHAPRHTPKGERKVLRYFLPYRIYMPPARHTVYSPLTFRFEPNLCHDQLPFKELEKKLKQRIKRNAGYNRSRRT